MDEMNRGGGKVRGPAAETGESASGNGTALRMEDMPTAMPMRSRSTI